MDVIKRLPRWTRIVAIILILSAALLMALHWSAEPADTRITLKHKDGAKGLVVLVHGLNGKDALASMVQLTRVALPDYDQLTVEFDSQPFSNASPYAIANSIERRIHKFDGKYQYKDIVLVGHSMGGMLLRKSFLWGSGEEEDRADYGRRGPRTWVTKVSRFVSLASINRGWSIDPAPKNMSTTTYLLYWAGERLARLSHSGELMLGLQRGAPFIADSRVQWIQLFRPANAHRPEVIHFLGDRDDIVSRADSMDLRVASNTTFVTLENTGHADIASALGREDSLLDRERNEAVIHALRGEIEKLEKDQLAASIEKKEVKRLVYLMHGIRDFGEWTDDLRETMESLRGNGPQLLIVNEKYGYFPMLPFVLYSDRQKNVRRFMDEYTENLARYPSVTQPDYVGHSNGTYILASALHHYKTLKVGHVYFAGSVVPKHYDWGPLLEDGRVTKVVNVVAAGDWVVALLPRFFEQIADWRGVQPGDGLLDIGSAGFRGFQAASATDRAIFNIKFASGDHGTAVDANDSSKLNAITEFIRSGDHQSLDQVFGNNTPPSDLLSNLSNLTWILWLAAASLLAYGTYRTFSTSRLRGWIYLLLLLGLLNSF
ncbi:alpha/beta fold hydrolase [Pseudomonas wadenswilerensis]